MWKKILMDYVKEPEKFPSAVIHNDSHVVAIIDKYPKARKHFLVISKKEIGSIFQLTRKDVDLLQHMKNVGLEIARKYEMHENSYKMGFHAIPSLFPLHLHIISDDFDSVSLKTRVHWNSFTTNFFVPISKVMDDMQSLGRVNENEEELEQLLKSPLKCHKCFALEKNMPQLKQHITSLHNASNL